MVMVLTSLLALSFITILSLSSAPTRKDTSSLQVCVRCDVTRRCSPMVTTSHLVSSVLAEIQKCLSLTIKSLIENDAMVKFKRYTHEQRQLGPVTRSTQLEALKAVHNQNPVQVVLVLSNRFPNGQDRRAN